MALLILLSCVFPPDADAAVPGVTRSELPADLRGLSGLAVDDTGRLWSVSERPVALVPLRLDGDRVVPDGAPLRVKGWPLGVDAESVAWLGPGRFVLGGESQIEGRARDVAREAVVTDGVARVARAWPLPYGPFGVTAGGNRGLEGIDADGGALVVASEMVAGRPRAALLWRVEGDAVAYATVRLTSADGKVSSVEVDGAHLLAIERHYGTVRLVEADLTWGTAEAPGTADARVVRDLAADLGDLPNLEGLATLPDGRIVLLSDNQGGAVRTGPTVALVLAPARVAAQPPG